MNTTRTPQFAGRRVLPWWMMGLGMGVGMISAGPARGQVAVRDPMQQGPSRYEVPVKSDEQKEGVRQVPQRITLMMRDRTVHEVLRALSTQSGSSILYDSSDPRFKKTITVRLTNVPLTEAVTTVLKGTGLVATLAADGETVVIRPAVSSEKTADSVSSSSGTVTGEIIDAATRKPISGVVVSISGTKLGAVTNEQGRFLLRDVRPGDVMVIAKLSGYRSASRPTNVSSGSRATANFELVAIPTTLSEVVTTATGNRARLEVGTDIGTIKVDSLLDRTLVRNVSDLLQARLPGVSVTNSNGAVGAPSKIRIRGVNSLALNNDPIVIMDGIRLNSSTTDSKIQRRWDRYVNGDSKFLAPSRLDDIDPNIIESIDVLRGPSAASLYGTEAANGVIVIKTKRAQVGPLRVNLSASHGWSDLPSGMPDQWFGDIRISDGRRMYGVLGGCEIFSFRGRNASDGTCHEDSAWAFNPANDPKMSNIGRGKTQSVSLGLSGGAERIQQHIAVTILDNIGNARMSSLEVRRVTGLWGAPPPSWLRRPNSEQSVNGSSTTTLVAGKSLNLNLATHVTYRSNIDGGLGTSSVYPSSASDTLMYLPTDFQRKRRSSVAKRSYGSLSGTYTPSQWLRLSGTFGGDFTVRTNETQQRSVDCASSIFPRGCQSTRQKSDDEIFMTTFSGNANTSFQLLNWLGARTTIGQEVTRTRSSSLQAGNYNSTLAFGSDLLSPHPVPMESGSAVFLVSEDRDESAVAGLYLEQTFVSRGKLFLTASIRFDAASAFGPTTNENPPAFPKLSMSWLISDEPWFPQWGVLPSVRVRSSYGRSGKQASQTAVLSRYDQATHLYDSTAVGAGIRRLTVGNPGLRPERTAEWEGGVDVSILPASRIEAGVTAYRKASADAIMDAKVAPSYGAEDLNQQRNIGSVQNSGVELSSTARILDSKRLALSVNVGWSRNTNKLVKSSPDANETGYGGRVRVGYPIFGWWGYPLVSYADLNGDGLLAVTEASFGDTLVFYSAPYPKSEANFSNTISVLNGTLSLTTMVSRVNGKGTPIYGAIRNRCAHDRSCTIDQQAAAMAMANGAILPVNATRLAEMSMLYTVPSGLLQKFLRVRSGTVSLSGRNLGLWTDYPGKDPNVNNDNNDMGYDDGTILPQPRNWMLRFSMNF